MQTCKILFFYSELTSSVDVDIYLFRVLARYLVPFLLASDGYFFCRNACSSRMASATDFLLLMSS